MADILTRREARQQAKQNRGYNRGQFQTAMVNAKDALRRNSDLRGRNLRQTARRMVAGTGEYSQSNLPPTFEEWINSPVLAGRPSSGGAEAARAAVQRGISKANRIFPITPITSSQSGLAGAPPTNTPTADLTGAGSFDNAFALARKNGMKVFTWNGKKYGATLAKKPINPISITIPQISTDEVSLNANPTYEDAFSSYMNRPLSSAVNNRETNLEINPNRNVISAP